MPATSGTCCFWLEGLKRCGLLGGPTLGLSWESVDSSDQLSHPREDVLVLVASIGKVDAHIPVKKDEIGNPAHQSSRVAQLVDPVLE